MEELVKNEGIKDWIPGTAEFKASNAAALKKAKEERIEYNREQLEAAEKIWRETLQKANKTWTEEVILSLFGITNEKEIDKLMDELRTRYLKPEAVTIGQKESFIRALLNALSALSYM